MTTRLPPNRRRTAMPDHWQRPPQAPRPASAALRHAALGRLPAPGQLPRRPGQLGEDAGRVRRRSSSSRTCTRSPWTRSGRAGPRAPGSPPPSTSPAASTWTSATLFVQSHVPEHAAAGLGAELHHRLRRGVPDDPVQGQDARSTGTDAASVGLFTYPVLMAADILLYQPARRAGGRGPAPAPGTGPRPGPAVQPPLRRDVHGAGGRHPEGGRRRSTICSTPPRRCPSRRNRPPA